METIQRPSTDEWINKMCYIHTREYYLAIKRNEVLTRDTFWINLGNLLSDRRQTQWPYIVWVHLYEVSRRGKSTATESRLVAVRAERGWRNQEVTRNGCKISFGGDENVPELDVLGGAQHCEYAKTPWTVYFKNATVVIFTVCEFYLSFKRRKSNVCRQIGDTNPWKQRGLGQRCRKGSLMSSKARCPLRAPEHGPGGRARCSLPSSTRKLIVSVSEAQPNGLFIQLCWNIFKSIPKDWRRNEYRRVKVA